MKDEIVLTTTVSEALVYRMAISKFEFIQRNLDTHYKTRAKIIAEFDMSAEEMKALKSVNKKIEQAFGETE